MHLQHVHFFLLMSMNPIAAAAASAPTAKRGREEDSAFLGPSEGGGVLEGLIEEEGAAAGEEMGCGRDAFFLVEEAGALTGVGADNVAAGGLAMGESYLPFFSCGSSLALASLVLTDAMRLFSGI